MNWAEFYDKLTKSNNILIILPEILDLTTVCTIGLIYYLLSSRNIKIDIAYSGKHNINPKYSEVLELVGIDKSKIISKIDPVFYNIIVPDITDVNLNWFINDGNLNIRLVSEKKPVDFNLINFNKSGGLYDLVLLINANRLKDIGALYSDHPDRLSKFDIISIGGELKNYYGYNITFLSTNQNSDVFTYLVKNVIENGIPLNENIPKVCVIGLAWLLFYMKTEDLDAMNLLINICSSYNITYKDLISKYIFDPDSLNIRLREIVLKNVKLDTSKKLAYSVISQNDLSNLGINSGSVDFLMHLNLNLDLRYEFIFLIIEQVGYTEIYVFNNINNKSRFVEIIEKLEGVSTNYFGYARLNSDAFHTINRILSIFGVDPNYSQNLQQTSYQAVNDEVESLNNNSSVNSQPQDVNSQDVNQQSSYVNTNSMLQEGGQTQSSSPFKRASEEMINSAFDPNAAQFIQQSSIATNQKPFEKADNII